MKETQRKRELRKKLERFFEYLVYFWPVIEAHELQISPYLPYLCDVLQELFEEVADWTKQTDGFDLLVNIAPGTTKSSMFSKIGPTYLWEKNPNIQQIAASYSSTPVKEFTAKFQRLINSDEFSWLYPNMFLTTDNVFKQTNNHKGIRYTTSTGGSVTGMHGDIIIYDDPNKPPKVIRDDNGQPKLTQGATLTEINNANAWHDDVLTTRKTNKQFARTVYVQQRVHRNDMSGYILKKAKKGALNLRHICLPAEIDMKAERMQAFERVYKDGQLIKEVNLKYLYSEEGLLDPVRLSRKILDKTKLEMGSYAYNAQYLQKPSRDKGGIIKAKYFPIVEASSLPTNLVKYFYTDPSEGKPNSDNMATICWSLYEGKMYVWEIMAKVKPFNEFIGYHDLNGKWVDKEYDLFVKKHGITRQSKSFFEAKSTGSPYIQYINAQTPYNAIEDLPKGSKMDRVQVVISNWEAGRVCLVKDVPGVSIEWITSFLEEAANFTGKEGDADDQVDVMTAAAKLTSFYGSMFVLDQTLINNDNRGNQESDDPEVARELAEIRRLAL